MATDPTEASASFARVRTQERDDAPPRLHVSELRGAMPPITGSAVGPVPPRF